MSWLWLNIPLAGLFFLTATLIPLWLVVRHPDTRTRASGTARRPADPAVASSLRGPAAGPAAPPAARAARQPELVGSSSR